EGDPWEIGRRSGLKSLLSLPLLPLLSLPLSLLSLPLWFARVGHGGQRYLRKAGCDKRNPDHSNEMVSHRCFSIRPDGTVTVAVSTVTVFTAGIFTSGMTTTGTSTVGTSTVAFATLIDVALFATAVVRTMRDGASMFGNESGS